MHERSMTQELVHAMMSRSLRWQWPGELTDCRHHPAVQAATAGVSVGSFENTTGAASWHRKLQQVGSFCSHFTPAQSLTLTNLLRKGCQ